MKIKTNVLFKIFLLLLPKHMTSRIVAFFARKKLPRPLRILFLRKFVKKYNINLNEIEQKLHDFPTLQEFFTRRLKPGMRPIDERENVIVSPADGVISQYGEISDGKLLQIKGKNYNISQLIPNPDMANLFQNGYFMTIYLSPRDYHRVHMAAPGQVIGMEYTPGRLLPVNDFAINNFNNLLATNERLTTYFEHPDLGKYAAVDVGALIVGGIKVCYDDDFCTNKRRQRKYFYRDLENEEIYYDKGEEFSRFEFGSTVVLLFQKDKIEPFIKKTPLTIKLGQPIAQIKHSNSDDSILDNF